MRRRQPNRRANRRQGSGLVDELLTLGAGAALGGIGILAASRWIAAAAIRRATRILMTDPYDRNLYEIVSATSRYGVQRLLETNLRSAEGRVIQRPFGSAKRFPDFSNLMFDAAQLHTMPTAPDIPVDMRVTIGPRAARPMVIEIPVMVSAMAYGWALSEKAKISLALGTAAAGTATNTGQGPFLESERKAAKKLIYQYHRGQWANNSGALPRCDAVEIQLGQGAAAGLGLALRPWEIDSQLRQQMGLQPEEPVISNARQPEVQRPEDLGRLVGRLREQARGVPIGVKLAAGHHLEEDLRLALEAEVDFITVDGAQGATKGAPPIVQDDFGLPTLYALVRAVRFLERQRALGNVSLIISGGLVTAGDFLKAIALGADAINIGTAALYAMSHTQVTYSTPWEPPTQLVWYNGKFADSFDPEEGGKALHRFLQSISSEMGEGVRALGKVSIHEISKEHLFALDRETAEICGVPLGYQPQAIPNQN